MNCFPALTQCYGIPLSFLSLALTSVKLFYSQRLGRFPDVDPSLPMTIFVFPFILFQIIGPLYSLVLVAVYLKEMVIVFVLFMILVQFITMKFVLLKGKEYAYLNELYELGPGIPLVNDKKLLDSKNIMNKAIFTAWISPCTVWSNNSTDKSYFLLVSSTASYLSHAICLSCIYIYTFFVEISVTSLAPVTHCFTKTENYSQFLDKVNYSQKSVLSSIKICTDKVCMPIQRLCSDMENPTDLIHHIILPIGFSLLIISLIASVCLQFLGNYYSLYQWSKRMLCCCPIVHASLLQDFIINNYEKVDDLFTEMIGYDSDIINKKDPLYGETPMISAAKTDLHELLKNMIYLNGDIFAENSFGESILELWDIDESERKEIELRYIPKAKGKTWKVEPMNKAVRKNKVGLFCFLKIIGVQMSNDNLISVIDHLEDDKLSLKDCNAFLRFIVSNSESTNGEKIIHAAARRGSIKALKKLIDINCSVNELPIHGKTPLSEAASENEGECVRILIEHGADVNKKSFDESSPLHFAAWSRATKCIQLLIENKAEINCENEEGWTPLHVAAFQGDFDCLEILIDNDAEISCKDEYEKTPLHYAASEGHIDCLEILIDNEAEISCEDEDGWTPLHYAASEGHIDCMKMLIENGAYINVQDNRKQTPLTLIVFSEDVSEEDKDEGIEILIRAGAYLYMKDSDNEIPLDYKRVQRLMKKKPELQDFL
jgi:ankyrin repeat protein